MVDENPDGPHDPSFLGFARQIDLGDDFNAAMERGDFIAAEGVAREWERTGHECALELLLEKGGHIVLGARQGQRKLGVSWSLYPPPRHEPAETL